MVWSLGLRVCMRMRPTSVVRPEHEDYEGTVDRAGAFEEHDRDGREHRPEEEVAARDPAYHLPRHLSLNHSLYYILYTINYMLYTIYYTLYTIYYTLNTNTIHYTLYTIYYIP